MEVVMLVSTVRIFALSAALAMLVMLTLTTAV